MKNNKNNDLEGFQSLKNPKKNLTLTLLVETFSTALEVLLPQEENYLKTLTMQYKFSWLVA
jgi:hypothetical protein